MTIERKVINLAQRKLERLGGTPPPEIKTEIPDFITPPDIGKMSDAQLEQVLGLVRLRRMQSQMIYERTQTEKARVTEDKAKQQLEKKSEQVFNELEKVFKNLDKLEIRVNEMRALRVQAGLDF